jgi:hypothetical protein
LLLPATLDMPKILLLRRRELCVCEKTVRLESRELLISAAVSVGAVGECPLGQLSVDLIITGTVSFPSIW